MDHIPNLCIDDVFGVGLVEEIVGDFEGVDGVVSLAVVLLEGNHFDITLC